MITKTTVYMILFCVNAPLRTINVIKIILIWGLLYRKYKILVNVMVLSKFSFVFRMLHFWKYKNTKCYSKKWNEKLFAKGNLNSRIIEYYGPDL